jgi:Fe-S-cluster-containing hydrogenase component 2/CRP-like cAMP-binding protein
MAEVNPPVDLGIRETDVPLPIQQFGKLPPFSLLKSPPALQKFPGSVRLRRFRTGEVVCQQGAEGWSAFYILADEDVRKLQELIDAQIKAAEAGPPAPKPGQPPPAVDPVQQQQEVESLRKLRQQIEVPAPAHPAPPGQPVVARVYLNLARRSGASARGLWRRLFGDGGSATPANGRPAFIPNDGPTDLDSRRMDAALYANELFGEMSCLYRTRRSATVVAARDCYMVEMLRNVLDKLVKDPAYRAKTEETYRRRVLGLHLREFNLFRDLEDKLLELVREQAELVEFNPGALIFDQHDHPDSLYLVRNGTVRVLQNTSFLIAADDVVDPVAVLTELKPPGESQCEARQYIWNLLPEKIRARLDGAPTAADKLPLAAALNEVVKQTKLHETDAIRCLVREAELPPKIWKLLANYDRRGKRDLYHFNRAVLSTIYTNAVPACDLTGLDPEPLLMPRAINDWKVFTAAIVNDKQKLVWPLLPPSVQEGMKAAASGQAPDRAAQQVILDGLNDLIQGLPLLLYQSFQDFLEQLPEKNPGMLLKILNKVRDFLPSQRKWTEYDFYRLNRALNRLVLEALCRRGLQRYKREGTVPRVLAYRGRGEFIGELSLFLNEPRDATCVAYNHPELDPALEVGPVQLVRIDRSLMGQLRQLSRVIEPKIKDLVAKSRKPTSGGAAAKTQQALDPILSARAAELGLMEGQKLMLVDLERCTRCDECVKACVRTHDDDRTRLFLDGPRFGKYLVPMTCRSCLDPVCMIGCPVGSIHRGNNAQIVIEDWCIGCEQCAKQCPYGSIQMHDIGVIPECTPGWRFLPASALPAGAEWFQPAWKDADWIEGTSPFQLGREFGLKVEACLKARKVETVLSSASCFCFRYPFELTREQVRKKSEFQLEVTAPDPRVAPVWINGKKLTTDAKPRQGRLSYTVGGGAAGDAAPTLRIGRNLLAVQVEARMLGGGPLLSVRMDEVLRSEERGQEVTQKVVTLRAVVCDLCSELGSQDPACVKACPHDAALRVNAWTAFPAP